MDDYIVKGFKEYMRLLPTDSFLQGLTACGIAYILFFTIFCIFYKRLEDMVYNLKMNKWVVLLLFNIGTILVSLAVYGVRCITQREMNIPFIIILSMIEMAINFLSVAKFRDDLGYIEARSKGAKVGLAVCLNILILLKTI